jgi:hypothetical protein
MLSDAGCVSNFSLLKMILTLHGTMDRVKALLVATAVLILIESVFFTIICGFDFVEILTPLLEYIGSCIIAIACEQTRSRSLRRTFVLERKITAEVLPILQTTSQAARALMSGPELFFLYTQQYKETLQAMEVADTSIRIQLNGHQDSNRKPKRFVNLFSRLLRWMRKVYKLKMFDTEMEKAYWDKRHPLFLWNTMTGMLGVALFSAIHAFLDPVTYCGSSLVHTPGEYIYRPIFSSVTLLT